MQSVDSRRHYGYSMLTLGKFEGSLRNGPYAVGFPLWTQGFYNHQGTFRKIELSVRYVCSKCGESFSRQDYDESRFCKTCGSFLMQRLIADSFRKRQVSFDRMNDSKSENASKEKTALMRAAESIRQRAVCVKGYEIVSEAQMRTEQNQATPNEGWIWNSEYEDALKLKQDLVLKYKGKTLEEAIPGEVLSNEQGQCYAISAKCACEFKNANYEESRRRIVSDLKILAGIGPVREKALKQQGYKTIEHLQNHLIWRKQARDFMKLVDAKEVGSTQNWLWRRLPKSHPLLHYLAGFCNDDDFAIIDIETLGLSERPIILLGVAKPGKDSTCTHQYLLRDIQDEPSAIWSLVSQLEPNASLITFNGKSFDIPYIKQRLAYYGLESSLENPHFDVLHFTRRALRDKLTDCRLETAEKYLGIRRGINIPGALVPSFYDTYLRTRNVGPLVAIVEHNKQDLLTLGTLFSKLYEEWSA